MSVASREAFFTTRCAIGPSQRARERPSASIVLGESTSAIVWFRRSFTTAGCSFGDVREARSSRAAADCRWGAPRWRR